MRQTAFLCNRCGVELTPILQEASEQELAPTTGCAAVAPGHYVELGESWTYRDFVTGRSPENQYVGTDGDLIAFAAGDYLLNFADVRHSIASNAAHGCCGLQPRDELNATCTNGHVIGTVHADECWSALVFRLTKRATEAVELET